MVRTLAHRAETISSDRTHLNTERNHLNSVFLNCQYPEWAVKKGFQAKKTRVQHDEQDETKGYAAIPYVKGISEPISRILRTAGLKVAMKPHSTIRQLLGTPKDKDDTVDKAGVVYKITCNDCEATYIGQTGRHLRDRLKEHRKAVESGNTHHSGVAEHAYKAHHNVDLDNITVLDQESNLQRRLVREALHIRHQAPAMNRDRGLELPVPFLKLAGDTRGRSRDNVGASGSSVLQ